MRQWVRRAEKAGHARDRAEVAADLASVETAMEHVAVLILELLDREGLDAEPPSLIWCEPPPGA